MTTTERKKCLVIGHPVIHSLSPAMHNAAYKALGVADEFDYSTWDVQSGIEEIVEEIKAKGIRGCAFTMPYKKDIVSLLDWVDETAKEIGAVNTVVNEGGILRGYNTDWLGIVDSLERLSDLKGKKVAIIGAGGAARAAIYGVLERGAIITDIFNRTPEHTEKLAREFGLNCAIRGLDEIKEARSADIVINTTPIGMKGVAEDETPLPKEFIGPDQIVFDVVYSLEDTQLIKEAKDKGAKVVAGTEMVLRQAVHQFFLHTGIEPTEDNRKKVEQAMEGAIEEAREESRKEIKQETKEGSREKEKNR